MTAEYKWSITTEEMATTVDGLSWKKATGCDDMPDTFFHGILEEDRKKDSYENTRWLADKIEDLLNQRNWPQYMFSARPILLSKTGDVSVRTKDVRILSVIPAVAKLTERVILNRIEGRLYGPDGVIPHCQQGFRPGAGTAD